MKNLFRVKFVDAEDMKPFKNVEDKRLQKILESRGTNNWQRAIMYKDGKPKEYYHISKGLQALTHKQFLTAINEDRVNLYIIYTHEHKKKTGDSRGKSIKNACVEEMPTYWNENVLKIQAYHKRKVIAEMTAPHQINYC
jgi:hypothetical protein